MDVNSFFSYWMVIMYSLFALGIILVFLYEYSSFKRKH